MVPSYRQLAEHLRSRIVSGEFPPGARMPAERELIADSSLSRITVRQGLGLLEREGLLVRKQGLGTFVRPSIDQELTSVQTITEVLLAKGIVPQIKVLSFGPVIPPPNVREVMQLPAGDRILLVKRLYRYKRRPIALIYIYLPLAVMTAAEVLRNANVPTETTYTVWEDKLHVRLKEARHTIRAAGATREDATALKIRPGAPILVLERVTYAADGRPLEFILFHYHADHYAFSATLPRTVKSERFGLNGHYVSAP
ncbi:MAG: GntR family transcriptional regulator [Candidatus Rokubacteria bacterium]|nr:GntR family transcriptional regulator [Candidatus Rokubacteria bacterium]